MTGSLSLLAALLNFVASPISGLGAAHVTSLTALLYCCVALFLCVELVRLLVELFKLIPVLIDRIEKLLVLVCKVVRRRIAGKANENGGGARNDVAQCRRGMSATSKKKSRPEPDVNAVVWAGKLRQETVGAPHASS